MTLKGLPSTYNKDLQVQGWEWWVKDPAAYTLHIRALGTPRQRPTELPLPIMCTQPLTALRALLCIRIGCARG